MKKTIFLKFKYLSLLLLVFTGILVLVACREPNPVKLKVVSNAEKVEVIEGENLNMKDFSFFGVYKNGEERAISSDEIRVLGFNSKLSIEEEYKQTIKFVYLGLESLFDIYIIPQDIESVTVLTSDGKTRYVIDDAIDLNGYIIFVTYKNGRTSEVPLTISNITNINELPIENNIFNGDGNYSLEVNYRGINANNTIRINISKHDHKTESFLLVSNTTALDDSAVYGNELPSASKIEVSSLTNGKYKIIESVNGIIDEEKLSLIAWQDSPIFTNLIPNQEYLVIGLQGDSNRYNIGNEYRLQITTKPLQTPSPVISSKGYNFIEINKLPYIEYLLNRPSDVVISDSKIRYEKLEPNQEYIVTARYNFTSESNQIIPSIISEKLMVIDNPFQPFVFQEYTYNNLEHHYQVLLKDEFSNFGNIITEITYNGSTTVPTNSGTYEVKIKHRFSPNILTAGMMRINKKSISLNVLNVSKEYFDQDPIFDFNIPTELPVGITKNDILATFSRVAGESVGSYQISLVANHPELNFFINQGTLLIKPKVVYAEVNDINKTFGQSLPSPSFKFISSTPKFHSGDDQTFIPRYTYTTSGINQNLYLDSGIYDNEINLTISNPSYQVEVINRGAIIVSPYQMTVDIHAKEKVYGETDPILTYSLSNEGFRSQLGLKLSRSAGNTVGNYQVVVSNYNSLNFKLNINDNHLVVKPTPITFKVNNYSIVYGQNYQQLASLSVVSGRLVGIDKLTDFSIEYTPITTNDVGTYQVGAYISNSNYLISVNSGTLTVLPKPVKVTPLDNQEKVYGEDDPLLNYTINGLLENEQINIILGRTSGEDVGNYQYDLNNSDDFKNYTFSLEPKVFSIKPRLTQVSMSNLEKTYGDSDPIYSFEFTNLVNEEDSNHLQGYVTRVSGEEVGNYQIGLGTLKLSNYKLELINSYLVIKPREVMINYNLNSSYEYGSVVNLTGATGEVLSNHYITLTGYNINVGKYLIRPVIKDLTGRIVGQNYFIINGSFELTISKALLQVKPLVLSKVYGSEDPIYRYQVVSGLQYQDRQQVLSGLLSREIGEDVGEYLFDTSNLIADNYEVILTNDYFRINPKTIIVDYINKYIYNEEIQEVVIKNSSDYLLSVQTNPAIFKNAGTYQLTFTIGNPNYILSSYSGIASINKKVVELVVNNQSRKSNEPNPDFSINTEPLSLLDETFDPNNLVYQTPATSSSPFGTYPIDVVFGFTSNNYEFIYQTGWLTVSPPNFNLELLPTYIYNGLEQPVLLKIFNESNEDITSNFTITLNYTNGFVPINVGTYPVEVIINDGSGDITFNKDQIISKRPVMIDYLIEEEFIYGDPYSSSQATGDNLISTDRVELFGDMNGIGTKTLTARIYNNLNSEVTNNYQIINSTHTFEIVKSTLTIFPMVTQKVYGEVDPELLFRAEGFKKSETTDIIAGSLLRESGEEVGLYLIDVSNLTTDYYQFVLNNDNRYFTINKRHITIDYDLLSTYIYGDTITYNPSADNLLIGDTIELVGLGSEVGNYTVKPTIIDSSDEEVTNNYHFTNSSFAFSITKRDLVITPDELSKVYGDRDQTITYEVAGYQYSDSNLLTGSLARTEGEVVGDYEILIGTLRVESNNYQIVLESKQLTIYPKSISFTHKNSNYIYSGSVQEITLLSDNLVVGDNIVVTNNHFIDAGNYLLTIKIFKGEVDVTNSYLFDVDLIQLTINKKVLSSVMWSYDNESVSATSQDLVNGESFELNNHQNLTPGVHVANIINYDNYEFSNVNDISYEYIHYGVIDLELLPQSVIYDGNMHQYDISNIINLGYLVDEVDNQAYSDVNSYTVQLIMKKEYYFDKEYTTSLVITPLVVEANFEYQFEYIYSDTNYLNNSLVTFSQPLAVYEYSIINYQVVDDKLVLVNEFVEVGVYRVYYYINNYNYHEQVINYLTIEIKPATIEVIVNNQLLIAGEEHSSPSYHTLFTKNIEVNYEVTNLVNEDKSVLGITNGQKHVTISEIIYQGQNITNQFNIVDKTYLYTVLDRDYLYIKNYNKDDLERSSTNPFGNGYVEATKNPVVGFGYRYHNEYYANKYYNNSENIMFNSFSTNHYYKFGNLNHGTVYLGGLIDLNSLEFDNITINGLGLTIMGLKVVDLTADDIHSSARTIQYGINVSFGVTGKQTITLGYQKYGKEVVLGKLNIEVIDSFTNITTYEELFNSSNITLQNIILNNGIPYKQTLGVTIAVNQGKTLYGNNYEINSYSSSYLDNNKPVEAGRNLLYTTGIVDNVRIIQRRATSYESAGSTKATVNSDTAVSFNGGIIRNSFIAYGRETVEITNTTSDLLIEDTTILGGSFGIRRRSVGKLTLNNVNVIQRPDRDLGGMGVPIVFLDNSGVTINKLEPNLLTLEILGSSKIFGFETLEKLKNATLPFGVSDVVGSVIEDLWTEFESELVYRRGDEFVMSPSILFVSSESIKNDLDNRNPIVNFAKTFQYAYKDITIAAAYGYVYTYNHVDKNEFNQQMYSQLFIENNKLLLPPNYQEFTGEYQGV